MCLEFIFVKRLSIPYLNYDTWHMSLPGSTGIGLGSMTLISIPGFGVAWVTLISIPVVLLGVAGMTWISGTTKVVLLELGIPGLEEVVGTATVVLIDWLEDLTGEFVKEFKAVSLDAFLSSGVTEGLSELGGELVLELESMIRLSGSLSSLGSTWVKIIKSCTLWDFSRT